MNKQTVDSIARKCANDLQKYTGQDQNTNELIAKHIIQSTNLVQLLECVEALREVHQDLKEGFIRCEDCGRQEPLKDTDMVIIITKALTTLDRAMKGEKV